MHYGWLPPANADRFFHLYDGYELLKRMVGTIGIA